MKINKIKCNSIKIHVLASFGNVQASPHPPKPSNPPGINKNDKIIKIHVLASIGKVKAPPPNFSKPVGTISNAMNDGNQYTKKEVGGRGGAYK